MPYPTDNRSSSLSIDFHYLRRQVGKALGYEYDHGTWDDEQNEAVLEIIDEGVRNYCFPPPLPQEYGLGQLEAHQWSWMRPEFPLTTQASQREYNLPEDWDHNIGNFCFVDSDNNFYGPIKWSSASRLRTLEYQTSFTSYPQWAAWIQAESTGEDVQRKKLILHPTPDSTYDLKCQYQAYAQRLSERTPHPPGGQIHGPGFLASCLAIAELRNTGKEGPMWQRFWQLLAGNITRDWQTGADVLGYNGNSDGSGADGRGMIRRAGGLYYNDPTYGGSSYTGQ